MNVFFLLLPALAIYFLAHRFYAPFLGRVFGEDDSRTTPAVEKEDGVDYVPTRPHILFAHHFSAIAAAGPILGPTFALLYGYLPAFLWIVIGAVLIGAVHDFATLFVAMREGGRSIAEIARRLLGKPAFILFALFIVFNLVVVNAVFINLTAKTLTAKQPTDTLHLEPDQTLFRTEPNPKPGGPPLAVVGGIASMSTIALTAVAPILGFFLVKRKMAERFAYPLAMLLCVGSVIIGFEWPVQPPALDLSFLREGWVIDPLQLWVLLIAAYVLIAAAVPVWLVLQPREFVSVQFLYIGILLLIAAAFGVGFRGEGLTAPAVDLEGGAKAWGSLWPILFVTIACGAISGFHGLVSSGTTCKQIPRESLAKHIGYLAMLGESCLALLVTIAVGVGFNDLELYRKLAYGKEANPVLAFANGVAGVCEKGLHLPYHYGLVFGMLMVEGFVLDTLDVAIRLNRYLLEEIWGALFKTVPAFMKNFWFNSGLAVALMLLLAYRNTAGKLWHIFGTGNQLLASLSLLVLTVWLVAHRRRCVYVFIPAVLVGVTTVGSLLYLLFTKYLPEKNYTLAVTDIVFLALAAGVGFFAARAGLAARAARAAEGGESAR